MHAAGRQLTRVAGGVVIVVAAALALDLAGARLEVAAVALLLAVLGAALLGYASGLAAAATGYALLLYAFTPPIGAVKVRNLTDFVVGVAYFVGAVVAGVVVARLDDLRRRSERHAREAGLRLVVTERAIEGVAPEALLRDVADAVTSVFGVAWCRIRAADADVEVSVPGRPTRTRSRPPVHASVGDVTIDAGGGLGIDPRDQPTVDGLAAALRLAVERLRLADEAQRHQVDAELARSRAGFLAAVTHDLRTPLATIKAATAALMVADSPLTDAERAELLSVANADAAELDDLITKVLELAGIRSGPLVPARRTLAPDEVVHAALRRVARTVADRDVRVEVAPGTPAVDVDLVMMEHALANLLENAARHAPDSSVEVRVGSTDGGVGFRVVDHGPGVDPADVDRIFDEFVRTGDSVQRGFGLGLTIVRVLVEAHGGTVRCEATPGGGATFVIDLPVTDAAEAVPS